MIDLCGCKVVYEKNRVLILETLVILHRDIMVT